jgi:hypothetical protein
MSDTLRRVQELAANGEVRISEHGYDELSADGILAAEAVEGVSGARVVEDYPDYPKGPCVLVLQRDDSDRPIHVVWGIPRGKRAPAVLVTAYRPRSDLWTSDFLRRRR